MRTTPLDLAKAVGRYHPRTMMCTGVVREGLVNISPPCDILRQSVNGLRRA